MLNTDTNERWETGVEAQIRWTRGAWSLGAGVQSTSNEQKGTFPTSEGPDGLPGTSDDFDSQWDFDASTLGLFLEPRFVVGVFADRVGLYVVTRMTLARMTENESGTRPETNQMGVPTGQEETYSVEGTRTSFAAYAGPGLLIRLTSHVNLDLGVTGGYAWWGGEPEGELGPDLVDLFIGESLASKSFFTFGIWVGLAIGIG